VLLAAMRAEAQPQPGDMGLAMKMQSLFERA